MGREVWRCAGEAVFERRRQYSLVLVSRDGGRVDDYRTRTVTAEAGRFRIGGYYDEDLEPVERPAP